MQSANLEAQRPPPEKLVTFFNAEKQNVIPYVGKILEPPLSCPIQTLDTNNDGMFSTNVISATEKVYTGRSRGCLRRECGEAYAEALSQSRTFVIADSYFSADSFLNDTQGFLQHGLQPLKEFYESGGRVVVVCKEGFFAIGEQLSPIFGCEWQLGNINSEECVPSERGRVMFGSEAKELYAGKGHMMIAPEHERLYTVKVVSKKEYASNYYGLDLEQCDEDDLKDVKKSWERHIEENSENSLIALHQHESGGSLVWMGDRNEEDPNMRAVFAKLCCG